MFYSGFIRFHPGDGRNTVKVVEIQGAYTKTYFLLIVPIILDQSHLFTHNTSIHSSLYTYSVSFILFIRKHIRISIMVKGTFGQDRDNPI